MYPQNLKVGDRILRNGEWLIVQDVMVFPQNSVVLVFALPPSGEVTAYRYQMDDILWDVYRP